VVIERLRPGRTTLSAPAGFFQSGQRSAAPAFPVLSSREHDILELIAGGLSNPAIAQRLALSEKTVRNNVSSIIAKLRVADRAEAIVRARDAGLGRYRVERPAFGSRSVVVPQAGPQLGPGLAEPGADVNVAVRFDVVEAVRVGQGGRLVHAGEEAC
jgi:DNA-binding CsgD family transcriptional regulator